MKLHNLVVAIGMVVILFGLANVASVVSAISTPETETAAQTGILEAGGWPEQAQPVDWVGSHVTSQTQVGHAAELEALPAPSASFLAQAFNEEVEDQPSELRDLLLPEQHDAEMLYPQEIAEQIAALPTPATPETPLRLIIPAIDLEAPILPAEAELLVIAERTYQVWRAPDQFGAGWHVTSAPLGATGNTVLNGHHNVFGEVFKRLAELSPGDEVIVESEIATHHFIITNRMIQPEKYASLSERVQNARWILPSEDERLTLVTCWPFESNTHRLILVARPDT